MFSARVGARVLGGGLCACASAAVYNSQLIGTADTADDIERRLSGGSANKNVQVKIPADNKPSAEKYNRLSSLKSGAASSTSGLSSFTQAAATMSSPSSLTATTAATCCDHGGDPRDCDDEEEGEDGGAHYLVMSSASESGRYNNSNNTTASRPGLELDERVNYDCNSTDLKDCHYSHVYHTGSIGPDKFVLETNCKDETLSPAYEEENDISDYQVLTSHGDETSCFDVEAHSTNGQKPNQRQQFTNAVNEARIRCWRKLYESGSPGMSVCVAVNGKVVYNHAFGYADLENNLLMGTGCIMRIASISKSITMVVLAKLVEEQKVDLDASVSKYVKDWPEKTVDGEKIDITVRQLCSHLSGIRHYEKKGEEGKKDDEFELKEYLLNKKFKTTQEALELFKNDELMHRPGSKFLYTTHGWTLIAAVIESVTGQPFDKYMKKQFKVLGLTNTYLDESSNLIYNRSKYYVRDEHHRLKNAPAVDNSYKWAGGGFLSNVHDLVRFGNAMLYSYQKKDGSASQVKPQQTKSQTSSSKAQPPAKPQPETKVEPAGPDNQQQRQPGTGNQEHKVTSPEAGEQNENNQTKSSQTSVDPVVNEVSSAGQDRRSQVVGAAPVVQNLSPFSPVNMSAPAAHIKYLPGYLKQETMAEMWRPVPEAKLSWGGENLFYGLGWAIRPREKTHGFCKDQTPFFSHTGGAIGASSVLFIAPHSCQGVEDSALPKGVVVSILCNMQSVGLSDLAADLANIFKGISVEKPARVDNVFQC